MKRNLERDGNKSLPKLKKPLNFRARQKNKKVPKTTIYIVIAHSYTIFTTKKTYKKPRN